MKYGLYCITLYVFINLKRVLGENVKPVQLFTNNSNYLTGKRAFLTGFGAIDGRNKSLYHNFLKMHLIVDNYQRSTLMRMALLYIATPDKCRLSRKNELSEICCTSSLDEGKLCKVGQHMTITMHLD